MRINGQRSTKEIRAELRELRAQMKSMGIRRSSFMNGGHSPASYSMNARAFALESELAATQLAAALPTLNPTASPEQHANAAARIVADMIGGAA